MHFGLTSSDIVNSYDIRFGDLNEPAWGIEYYQGKHYFGYNTTPGLNFFKPNGSSSVDYKLFISDNGNVGIGTGYPEEKLHVAGDIYCADLTSKFFAIESDKKLKENIDTLHNYKKLLLLQPLSYNYKKNAFKIDSITPHNTRKQFGFIAQDVQEVFPELVRAVGSDSTLAINYIGLIPVLVEGMKEQQSQIEAQQKLITALQVQASASVSLLKEIEDLKKQLEKCCDANTNNGNRLKSDSEAIEETIEETESEGLELFSNAPNPFNESTEIKMTVPASVESATLAIYDLNGRQLKAVIVTDRGSVTVTIEGSELAPGMYLYSLLADGQLVDTKTMVVTE